MDEGTPSSVSPRSLLTTCPSLSFHAINPRAKHDLLPYDASASTKLGKSAKIQLFFKVL